MAMLLIQYTVIHFLTKCDDSLDYVGPAAPVGQCLQKIYRAVTYITGYIFCLESCLSSINIFFLELQDVRCFYFQSLN